MRTSPLPIVVLTGFLGSGKTTILEHWLGESPVEPEKSALVINDFGPVNIDALLLNRPNMQMLSITGGCVCCTSYGELIDSLARLAESPNLELVWMETSGLAEPDEILDHLTSPRLQGKIRIQRLVQVIDAVHYPGPWRLRALEEEQLRYADWIILNKSDLVAEDKLVKLEAKIRQHNSHATLRRASRGETNREDFWNAHGSGLDGLVAGDKGGACCGCGHDHEAGHDAHAHHHAHSHEPVPTPAATLYFPLERSIPRAEFEQFLKELPANVYRAKGFIRFAEEPEKMQTFQQVCEQRETLLLPVTSAVPPASGLVFIGPQLDENWFKKRLAPWLPKPSGGTRLTVIP